MLPLAEPKVTIMEKRYWISPRRAGKAMARMTGGAEGPLVHYELANRTIITGAHGIAFLLRQRGPAATSERVRLHLPIPRPAIKVAIGPHLC